MSPDPVSVALMVARAIDACGLTYLVGGSLASSFTGEPRSTLDVDMVVAMEESDIECLIRNLGRDFYADALSIRRAINRRSSVNLIHEPTGIKVDVFIAGGTPLDHEQLERRRRVKVRSDPEAYLFLHTPEDILLQKLRWYRLSGEQSDRQWRDVRGIVAVQAGRLDDVYLRRQAEVLGVPDLLTRALRTGQA